MNLDDLRKQLIDLINSIDDEEKLLRIKRMLEAKKKP